jgi:hypothetical protein
MKTIFLFILIFADIFTMSGQTGKKASSHIKIDFDLTSPDRVYLLPHDLREISGITRINDSTIACVQDERGTVFMYDINKNRAISHFDFAPAGDYEDIARVGKILYVMKSNEVLTRISDFNSADIKTETYPLGIPGKDIEGLCYDKKNNRLLVVPKVTPDEDSENKNNRYIYGFDLGTMKLIKGPAFSFDLKIIRKFCMENNLKVPMKSKKKGKKEEPDIEFRISAIGIHPLTNKLFLISGMEHLIFVFDMNSNIEYVEKLDPTLFPQPEGITFMENGDILISNEGRNGSATLVRFNHKPAKNVKPGNVI